MKKVIPTVAFFLLMTTVSYAFQVSRTSVNEIAYQMAFDGNNFLIPVQGCDDDKTRLCAKLFSRTGIELNSQVIGTAEYPVNHQSAPIVAFDGANYLVVYQHDGNIYGRFVGTDGYPLGDEIEIAETNTALAGISYGSGAYLVLYDRTTEGATNVYAKFISSDGIVGDEIQIRQNATVHGINQTAFDGSRFFVVYTDDTNDTNILGRFIETDGNLSDEITIESDSYPSDNPAFVLFDGTRYIVLWMNEVCKNPGSHCGNWDIYGRFVETDGSLSDTFQVVQDAGSQFLPYAAFDGDNYLIIWTDMSKDANGNWICDPGEGTCWDIYGRYFDSSGSPSGDKFVLNKGKKNQLAGIAYFGWRYFVLVNSGINFSGSGPSQTVYGSDVFVQTVTPQGGNVPDVSVDIDFNDFGEVELDDQSEATVTITNNGTETLEIAGIELIGEMEEFSLLSETCSFEFPFRLPPGDKNSCTFRVLYSPTSYGRKDVTLRVTSDDPDTPVIRIPITGTGISQSYGEITLLSLDGGEVLPSGEKYTVTWGAPSAAVKFKLSYSPDNGMTWLKIAQDITGNSYEWQVPSINKSKARIKIVGLDSNGGVIGKSISDPFSIKTVMVNSPNGGETYTSGTSTTIQWSTNSTPRAVAKVTLSYSADGGTTWTSIATVNGNPGTYQWTLPPVGKLSDKCLVKVELKDNADSSLGKDTSDAYFKIEP